MENSKTSSAIDLVTEITERDLAVQLQPPHQRVLKNLTRNPDVSCVLCFRSPLTGAPRLVPIGKTLDFTTIEDAVKQYGAVASEIFSLSCGKSKGQSTGSRGTADGETAEHSASREMLEMRNRLRSAEIEIEELGRLKDLKEQLKQHEENLNSRENALIRMEDELMERMNRFMERVAEIEQREDDVAAREAALDRKSPG